MLEKADYQKKVIGLKIGIISDSHDHLDNMKKAVRLFNEQKVSHVFHAGDIISPFVAPMVFKELKSKLTCVFGNNDGERFGLKTQFTAIGAEISADQISIVINGKKIVLFHTIHINILESLIQSHKFDVIIYGHTHNMELKTVSNTLVINPGEACGYLTGKATIGIIDLDEMQAEIITL